MKIVVTGHRPQHLTCGFSTSHPQWLHITDEIERHFAECLARGPVTLITGMALGIDMLAASVALKMGIPYIAAVPCASQPLRWSTYQWQEYKHLLSHAAEVVVLQEVYDSGCMQRRNVWMVDRLRTQDEIPMVDNAHDHVLAVWDGKESGGTYNCIQYARKRNVAVVRIDPTQLTYRRRAELTMAALRAQITSTLLDALTKADADLRDILAATQNPGHEPDDGSIPTPLWGKMHSASCDIQSALAHLGRLRTPR